MSWTSDAPAPALEDHQAGQEAVGHQPGRQRLVEVLGHGGAEQAQARLVDDGAFLVGLGPHDVDAAGRRVHLQEHRHDGLVPGVAGLPDPHQEAVDLVDLEQGRGLHEQPVLDPLARRERRPEAVRQPGLVENSGVDFPGVVLADAGVGEAQDVQVGAVVHRVADLPPGEPRGRLGKLVERVVEVQALAPAVRAFLDLRGCSHDVAAVGADIDAMSEPTGRALPTLALGPAKQVVSAAARRQSNGTGPGQVGSAFGIAGLGVVGPVDVDD